MEKINIAELLKDCPQGMELDCTKYSNVYFIGVDYKKEPKIKLKIETSGTWCSELTLNEYGKESSHPNAKCLIFPKGKTTWEGFHRPFKVGDIVVSDKGDIHLLRTEDSSYCAYRVLWRGLAQFDKTITTSVRVKRLATEEEKEKLFKAIKDNGYKWNPETKTLKTLKKLVEPKFKVGDKIKLKENHNYIYTITGIREKENKYECGVTFVLRFSEQDNWELVPNKFDINTLKPFDKVLVRDRDIEEWSISLFSHCNSLEIHKYSCINGSGYAQCIPYQGNEHLLGKTDNCDEFYKTWK